MNKVYMATRNGKDIGVSFAPTVEKDAVFFATANRVFDFDSSYSMKEVDAGVNFVPSDSEKPLYSLRELTLEDAKAIFPSSPRTYESVEDLNELVFSQLKKETSYAVQEIPDIVYSFTIDEDDTVLELIYTDDEGDMYVRDTGEWKIVEEDDDAPTIFDKTLVDVMEEDQQKALEFWDSAVAKVDGIPKTDILKFAALVQ